MITKKNLPNHEFDGPLAFASDLWTGRNRPEGALGLDVLGDQCPNCGDEMVSGEGQQRLDLERVKKNMATSAEGEERLTVEFALQFCIKCSYTRGTIEASGYAGY